MDMRYKVAFIYKLGTSLKQFLMNIQNEYDNKYELYSEFGECLIDDLHDIVLKYERLNIEFITGRVKDKASLNLKISSKSNYESLANVTDVLGVRIVTAYKNEIPFIIRKIRETFDIDEENTNTNESKSDSEFGYSSYHIIVSNAKDKDCKTSDPKFKNLKAEIQVRTILQHAWANISHKIDYKAKQKPDSPYRRKLFQIAALLELADQEFSSVREEIIKSQKSLLPTSQDKFSDDIIIFDTLQAYIFQSTTCNTLDSKIADITFSALHYNLDSIEKNLTQIEKLNIKSLNELDTKLRDLSNNIVTAFKESNSRWIQYQKAFPNILGSSSSPRGISITYLYYHLTDKYD
jgi:putative GTP pyrophosphokinase